MLLREYELVVVLRPDTSEEDTQKVLDRIDGILKNEEGILLRRDLWGKRKLAYEIEKHQKGVYYYMLFLCKGETIQELERNLKMLEMILRYMTVKIADRVDSESRQEEMKQQLEEEAKRREEELAKQEEDSSKASDDESDKNDDSDTEEADEEDTADESDDASDEGEEENN